MDEKAEEFFDFESALTNEFMTTLKRFEDQNPQLPREKLLLISLVSSCRLFVTTSIGSGIPKEKCYGIFDTMYNTVEQMKKELDV